MELEDEQRHILEVIPQLDASAMCSECVSPLGWHDGSWPIRHPAGPCPAWPAWAEHRRIFRVELAELRRRRAEAEAAAQPKMKPIAVIPSGLPVEEHHRQAGQDPNHLSGRDRAAWFGEQVGNLATEGHSATAVDFPMIGNEGAVSFLADSHLSEQDREKIAYGNADRLLGLG